VVESVDVLLTSVAGVDPSEGEGRVGQAISHSSVYTVGRVLNIRVVNVMWAAHANCPPQHCGER
jgi:hypothetical protein